MKKFFTLILMTSAVMMALLLLAQNEAEAAKYKASGTYSYDPATKILTVNFTFSNFKCEGPDIGTEVFKVRSIKATSMTWIEKCKGCNGRMVFRRNSGKRGRMTGTWIEKNNGNTYRITFKNDGTFSTIGNVINCN